MTPVKTTYRNSFYKPDGVDGAGRPCAYGPKFYETESVPVEHAGLLIYQRQEFGYPVFDVVKDGVCLSQMAGLGGAKWAAETLAQGKPLSHQEPKPRGESN
jgi:hypothetical protein